MTMKNLPIGIQNLPEIINENYVYIDKTALVHQLITQGKMYFLSRPRRFGKSLTLSTIKEIFLGNRELFKGLAIDALPYDWKKYPVIHLSFVSIQGATPEELTRVMQDELLTIARTYQVELTKDAAVGVMFKNLIIALSKIDRVVILIDEYDAPILRYLPDIVIADQMRDVLRDFYIILKDLDPHLKFVFFTGVSKFSKVSIFSSLNQLSDITTDESSAALCGYTQEELEKAFADRMDAFASKCNITKLELLAELKKWYNGFRFSSADIKVYNPFSILNAFSKKYFNNYWFASGTPAFFVRLIKNNPDIVNQCMMLENQKISSYGFEKFNIENYYTDLTNLLYQTGYLTIIDCQLGSNVYQLGYPNFEVRSSMAVEVFNLTAKVNDAVVTDFSERFRAAIKNDNIELFCSIMKDFFQVFPHVLVVDREKFYQGVFFTVCKLANAQVDVEHATSRGFIDAVIETDKAVYVIEFKRNKSPEVALQQIKEKDYCTKFKIEKTKSIVLVGMSFEFSEPGGVEVDYLIEKNN